MEQFFAETRQPVTTVQSGSTEQLTGVALFIATRVLYTFLIVLALFLVVNEIRQRPGGSSPKSLFYHLPVEEMVAEQLSATLELLIPAVLLSLIIGSALGMLLAVRESSRTGAVLRPVLLFFAAIPALWLALLLLAELAMRRDILPLGERCLTSYSGECGPVLQRLEYLVLPLLILVMPGISSIALYIRQRLLQAHRLEANGSGVWGYILHVLLALPLALPFFLAGLISSLTIVEPIFDWPGLGSGLIRATDQHDSPLIAQIIQTTSINLAALYLFMSVLYTILTIVFSKLPTTHTLTPYPYLQSISSASVAPLPTGRQPLRLSRFVPLALLSIVLIVIAVPFIWDMNPNQIDAQNRYLPIGAKGHLLGTDHLGRDHLTRLIVGGRNALWLSFKAAFLAFSLGATLGGITGGLKRKWDNKRVRAVLDVPINGGLTVMGVLPWLPLVLVFMAANGADSNALILAFGLMGWVNVAPVIRSRICRWSQVSPAQYDFFAIEDDPFAAPQRTSWTARLKAFSLVITWAIVMNMATFLVIESCLSYLGLGLPESVPTWGNMLTKGTQWIRVSPHLFYAPGILLMLTVVCLHLLAERLRDRLDTVE